MAYSYVQYAGTGSTAIFAVTFPFLLRAHVRVGIGFTLATGTFTTEYTAGVGFAWNSDTQITMTVAPALLSQLTILRQTPTNLQLVAWQNGSPPTPTDLNISDKQNFYIAQELVDRVASVAVVPGVLPVDNLTSTSTVSSLSANQGRVLNEKIVVLSAGIGAGNGTGYGSELDYINAVSNPGLPVGYIVWLKQTETTVPNGFLYCGGAAKSRNQYPSLFSVVGTTYGVGDGSTTFNLPLKANLVNPFNNVSYNPFIKYGAKIGDDGIIALLRPDVNKFNTYNVNGIVWTGRSTPDIDSAVGDAIAIDLTSDALYGAIGQNQGGSEQLYAAKRNGNSWNKMTISSPPSGNCSGLAISPDGNILASIESPNFYAQGILAQWTRSGTSWINRQVINANIGIVQSNGNSTMKFSPDGNYLAIVGFQIGPPIVYKVVNGVLTLLAALPSAGINIASVGWHPSSLYLTVSSTSNPLNYVRVGDNFTVGPMAPSPNMGLAYGRLAWSTDGTKLVGVHQYSGAGAKIWDFNLGTATFTNLPSNVTTSTGYGSVVYPGSNTRFFDYANNRILTFASGTLEVEATNVPLNSYSRDCAMGTSA